MATDLERLVVSLEANIKNFDNNMRKAQELHEKNTRLIERRMADMTVKVNGQFMSLGQAANAAGGAIKSAFTTTSIAAVAAAAAAAGISIKGAFSTAAIVGFVAAAAAAAKDVAQMAENAKRLQMTNEELQQGRYAAKTLGNVSSSEYDAGLKALQEKSNKEFRDGEGELSKFLDVNKMKLANRAGQLKSINELLDNAATLIRNSGTEADKVDVARLFGLSEKFVKALEGGPELFRKIASEAGAAGAIIGDAAVRQAQEFEQRWTSALDQFGTHGRNAILPIVELINGLISTAGRFLDMLGSQLNAGSIGRKIDSSGIASLDRKELETIVELAKSKGQVLQKEIYTRLDALKALDAKNLATYGDLSRPAPNAKPTVNGMDELRAAMQPKPKNPTKFPKADKDTGSSADSSNDFDREEKSTERRIRNLNAEAEAIGKTAYEAAYAEQQYRLMDAAKNAGVETDPKVIASIERLANAYAQAKVKVDAAKEAFAKSQELQGFGGNQLIGILQGATKGMESLRQATLRFVDALLEAVLQAALLGKGPLAGIMGTMGTGGNYGGLVGMAFGTSGTAASSGMPMMLPSAGFAAGGVVGSDSRSTHAVPASAFANAPRFDVGGMVGPGGKFLKGLGAGARPIVAHDGEIILNAAQQKAVAGAMRGGQQIVQLTHAPVFNIMPKEGVTPAQVSRAIIQALEQYTRHLPTTFRKATMRFG